jgi:hypothetical protein
MNATIYRTRLLTPWNLGNGLGRFLGTIRVQLSARQPVVWINVRTQNTRTVWLSRGL